MYVIETECDIKFDSRIQKDVYNRSLEYLPDNKIGLYVKRDNSLISVLEYMLNFRVMWTKKRFIDFVSILIQDG